MKKFIAILCYLLCFQAVANEAAYSLISNMVKDDANDFYQNKSSYLANYIPTATASKLISDYENNQARYERDYNKKLVRIKTIASGVKTDLFGTAYVVANGKNQFEQVSLFLKDKDQAIDINKGDRLDLMCLGTKDNVMFPQLNKCVNTKDYLVDFISLNNNYLEQLNDNASETDVIIGYLYLSLSEIFVKQPDLLKGYKSMDDIFNNPDVGNKVDTLSKQKRMNKEMPFYKIPNL